MKKILWLVLLFFASLCYADSPGYNKSIPPDMHFTGSVHVWSALSDSTDSFRISGASITKVGTVDGRDVSVDGATLDALVLSTTTENAERIAGDVALGVATTTLNSIKQDHTNTALGEYSSIGSDFFDTSMGRSANSNGNSIAIGAFSYATDNAVALGYSANAENSVQIGAGANEIPMTMQYRSNRIADIDGLALTAGDGISLTKGTSGITIDAVISSSAFTTFANKEQVRISTDSLWSSLNEVKASTFSISDLLNSTNTWSAEQRFDNSVYVSTIYCKNFNDGFSIFGRNIPYGDSIKFKSPLSPYTLSGGLDIITEGSSSVSGDINIRVGGSGTGDNPANLNLTGGYYSIFNYYAGNVNISAGINKLYGAGHQNQYDGETKIGWYGSNYDTTTFIVTRRIDDSGRVGIGTLTPQSKLDVNGGIIATTATISHISVSTITFADGTVLTSTTQFGTTVSSSSFQNYFADKEQVRMSTDSLWTSLNEVKQSTFSISDLLNSTNTWSAEQRFDRIRVSTIQGSIVSDVSVPIYILDPLYTEAIYAEGIENNGNLFSTGDMSVSGISTLGATTINGYEVVIENKDRQYFINVDYAEVAGWSENAGFASDANTAGYADAAEIAQWAEASYNSDMVDGHHLNQGLTTDDYPSFIGLTIPTNASAGKVLTSDSSGNATWQSVSTPDLLNTTNTWSAEQRFGVVRISTMYGPIMGGTSDSIYISDRLCTEDIYTTGIENNGDLFSTGDMYVSGLSTLGATTINGYEVVIENKDRQYFINVDYAEVAGWTENSAYAGHAENAGYADAAEIALWADASYNSDMVDGYHLNQGLTTDDYPSFIGLTIPTNASAGKVLTSDISGNATWQSNPTSNILNTTNTWSGVNTFNKIYATTITANGNLAFVNTSTICITSTGEMVIGHTVAPYAGNALSVASDASTLRDIMISRHSALTGATGAAELSFYKTLGSINSPTDISALNTYLGGVAFYGRRTTPRVSVRLNAIADGTWGTGDYPSRFEFHTTKDGTSDIKSRMVIKNDGKVNISTDTTSYTPSDTTALLNVNGTIASEYGIKATTGTFTGGFYPANASNLPTTGYYEGSLFYNSTDKSLYISTETVSSVYSWKKCNP